MIMHLSPTSKLGYLSFKSGMHKRIGNALFQVLMCSYIIEND